MQCRTVQCSTGQNSAVHCTAVLPLVYLGEREEFDQMKAWGEQANWNIAHWISLRDKVKHIGFEMRWENGREKFGWKVRRGRIVWFEGRWGKVSKYSRLAWQPGLAAWPGSGTCEERWRNTAWPGVDPGAAGERWGAGEVATVWRPWTGGGAIWRRRWLYGKSEMPYLPEVQFQLFFFTIVS